MNRSLALLVIAFLGCDTRYQIEELRMPEKNPMTYEFDASIPEVHQAIRDRFVNRPGMALEFASDSSIVWGDPVLKRPENINDAFIWNRHGDTSRVYVRKASYVMYVVPHLIHISAVGEKRTEVEVRAIDPHIVIGVKFPRNVLPPDVGGALTKPVPPSTIEEYQILLEIGKGLGVEGSMPKLIMPEQAARPGS
jgi:hypothetical protein